MERPRPTAKDREREEKEEAQRKTRLSMRIGLLGIVVLFAGGFLAWLLPNYLVLFLVVMVLGILLILMALSLVWRFASRFRLDDETKLY